MGRGGGALPEASRTGLVRRGRVKARPGIESDVPLARITTVGIGGPLRALARPGTTVELEGALAWAATEGLDVRPIGLGSNVLAADGGVDALVIRLEGDLAGVEVRGDLLVAGGGAPNAVCLHRARAAGLGGFEFACAIPGTAGGGVRMNAGAYGCDWRAILERALIVEVDGARWLSADDLDLSYRHSALMPGQVVAQVEFRLTPRPAAEIKEAISAMQAQRKETQPTNKRTFGSVFKNPQHELGAGRMIEQCGLKGFRLGGALISPRHANFIENAGGATAREALGLMLEARRRVLEQFGVVLEREVELLGEIELPEAGALLT
jgi:UDP-N-acetylmuramate dehydrogenase